jgi:phosphoribosyl 1,2-cyclic phosphodiesterase
VSVSISVLASGSKANAILICEDKTKILIDAGLGIRNMTAALNEVRVRPTEISALLITHEHTDHVRGLAKLLERGHMPVYASAETLDAVDFMLPARIRTTAMNGDSVEIGAFAVHGIPVPHDASGPMAYHLQTGAHRITLATDLGEVPPELSEVLAHSTALIFESNHDEKMLREGSYPDFLKARILSSYGHLSNRQSAEALSECKGNGLRVVVLAHLSDENNLPELARASAHKALLGSGADLHVTTRSAMGPFLELK